MTAINILQILVYDVIQILYKHLGAKITFGLDVTFHFPHSY
jgi:hypothetical protein